MYKGRTL